LGIEEVIGTMTIEELKWDSAFFQRKIGTLKSPFDDLSALKDTLKKAKKDGFKYLTCRLAAQDTVLIRLLESNGFYLTDIGVTLETATRRYFQQGKQSRPTKQNAIKAATLEDIPALQKYITSLFSESRFYNDSFFPGEDADRLYRAWIENSVKGDAADVVFHIPGTGFISCRKSGKNSGQIVLIGVKKRFRGKGYGTALITEAMHWFRKERVRTVTVRTQLKNDRALNFYARIGFYVKGSDIVFGKATG
jgi:dTDP-4-amino-4,6-dideoxy-D-galactose acyltransferase